MHNIDSFTCDADDFGLAANPAKEDLEENKQTCTECF